MFRGIVGWISPDRGQRWYKMLRWGGTLPPTWPKVPKWNRTSDNYWIWQLWSRRYMALVQWWATGWISCYRSAHFKASLSQILARSKFLTLRLTVWVLVCHWLLFLRNVKDCEHLKCFKSWRMLDKLQFLTLMMTLSWLWSTICLVDWASGWNCGFWLGTCFDSAHELLLLF